MTLHDIRRTSPDRLTGSVRILLGVLFLMTGAMKVFVPMLGEAFSGQLLAAGLPLHSLTRWTVPFLEMFLGVALLAGAFARVAAVMVIGIMLVATYVHVVVDDASLFPLQPKEPIIPIVVIVASSYILWRGAGAWSFDLAQTRAAA